MNPFDTLCQQVFLHAKAADGISTMETALSLLSQAQVYELPKNFVMPANSTWTPDERQCYRIHLESLPTTQLYDATREILVQAIDPSVLIKVPFDRNLSGYSSKTRTEDRNTPLGAAVILDMDDLPSSESTQAGAATSTEEGGVQVHSQDDCKENNAIQRTMLLVSTKDWLQMASRIRYWRSESHRIKAAERELILNDLLEERWNLDSVRTPITAAVVSSPPQSAGALEAAPYGSSLPLANQSPISTLTSTLSPCPSPRATSDLNPFNVRLCPSRRKQPFQEHQLESLVQFMVQHGTEPSASSVLRGLLNLIRKQLGEARVLTWIFDRANLTEQKPEVSVAFLDLLAQLGLELVVPSTSMVQDQDQDYDQDNTVSTTPAAVAPTELSQSTSYSSATSNSTVVGATNVSQHKKREPEECTELTWTLGVRMDDRRLEYWICHLNQPNLPSVKIDDQSLLPSTATTCDTIGSHSTHQQRKNPIPSQIRKQFLQDRHTIAAGRIQFLTGAGQSPHAALPTAIDATTGKTTTTPPLGENISRREQALVLSSSAYAWSETGPSTLSSSAAIVRDFA
ncbi:hypothetical protein BGZ94_004876, partial [Podila epigama]